MKLVYSASNTVGSWLIRAGLSAPGMSCRYSHVEIMVGGEDQWPHAGAMLVGADGLKGEVVITSLGDRRQKATRLMVLDYPDIDPARAAKIAMSQLGKPYDYKGAFGLAFDRDWQQDDKWFCSELAAWVALQCGVPLLRADHVWRITPPMLELSPLGRCAE